MALAGVAAAEVTIDLSPTSITTKTDGDGITAAELNSFTLYNWQGTWENANLNGQVSAADKVLSLQIGATASNSSGGNFAAVRFAADTPLTLTFDIKGASSWGVNLATFSAEYTCEVYGLTADGTAAQIGSWSSDIIEGSAATNYSSSESIVLTAGEYSSYGVIFNSIDKSTLGNAAGMALNISNIKVTAENLVPEPATLSLLALAGLAARRRRSSR